MQRRHFIAGSAAAVVAARAGTTAVWAQEASPEASGAILFELPAGVSAEIDVKAKEPSVLLKSANKQTLGATAADIRALRPPEPYKGKGIRYADETIRRKEGKAAGKGK